MTTATTTSLTEPDLVPVTVIGGYLGAGKTTLINRLLAGDHGRRLAVLVNDFGRLNIDADLITANDGETISLTNGCVCCSIADALGDGLDQVLGLDPRPDQIIIEASGVADPVKVAVYGHGWPGCRLDAVVVLADSETIQDRSADRFVGELVRRQLAGADLILATKCDLVGSDRLPDIVDWIHSITGRPVIECRRDDGDARSIVELLVRSEHSTGDLDRGHPDRDRTLSAVAAGEVGGGEAGRLFESTVLQPAAPLDRRRLEAALAAWPDSIVRVKGRAVIAAGATEAKGGAGLHVIQRVGRRWSVEPTNDPAAHGSGIGSPDSGTALVIVAIRGTLDRATLLADLAQP